LQTPEPPAQAPAAPEQGQPPPAQQGEQPSQPQQPQIPQEYLDAHEWRGKIGEEATAFGGLDMVPQALKWSRMLFGLDQTPDGVRPAAHFMEALFNADPQVYREILHEVATTHVDRLLPLLEDRFFARNEIPKDRLAEVKDFLRYGRVAATDAAQREFVGQLKPEFQAIFPRLSEATRNWIVDQVDRGLMTLHFAEEQIRKENILLAIEERDAQTREREAEAAESERDRRARQVANEEIGRYQNVFVEAQARKHGIAPEDVLEKVAFVAGTLDAAASADEKHPARIAWEGLLEAAGSGNPLRIKAAMGRMQVVFEAAFDDYMGKRGKGVAPTNGHQPPAQPQQPSLLRQPQVPQFPPDKPNAAEDRSNASLYDHLFGRAPSA
jgi:hypothetical protein